MVYWIVGGLWLLAAMGFSKFIRKFQEIFKKNPAHGIVVILISFVSGVALLMLVLAFGYN